MRIYIDNTPNPNILKFVCDQTLTNGAVELGKEDNATDSMLAQELLRFPFIKKVYITANFVAIQKIDEIDWETVAEDLKEVVNRHLEEGTILLRPQQEDPFTVYVEMTPNPEVMKFVSNKLLYDGIAEARRDEEPGQIPIADALFEFDFTKEAFISENYISVTKTPEADWNEIALELRNFILEYLKSGKEAVSKNYTPKHHPQGNTSKSKKYTDTELEIKAIVSEYIQPAVAGDGGNIELIEFEEDTKTARMLLQGACSGCPSSTVTLKNGIETMLKQMMPGKVDKVEAVNG